MTNNAEPETTKTTGAHYVWQVNAELINPDETIVLGTVEAESETYGDKTDNDGMLVFIAERQHIENEYLFKGTLIPTRRVVRFTVNLIAATNRAAALPEQEPII